MSTKVYLFETQKYSFLSIKKAHFAANLTLGKLLEFHQSFRIGDDVTKVNGHVKRLVCITKYFLNEVLSLVEQRQQFLEVFSFIHFRIL